MVSHDEQYLAVAESGKHPHITVYAIQTAGKDHTKKALLELKGHKHRIDGIVFSPNRKYIVSVCNQEGSMFLWQGEELVAKNRLTKTINKVMFDSAQNLITVGRGYFKLWKFNEGEAIRRLEEDCWMIDGRVINFGKKFSTKDFIDAAVYRANTS